MSMTAKGQTRGARSLDEMLEALATPSGTPAGGAAVALTGAMAAALVELCCRAGGAQAGGGQVEALATYGREANALRARLVRLGEQDGAAYRRVLRARRRPAQSDVQREERERAVEAAMQAATGVPREIAAACLGVLDIAERAVALVPHSMLGDLVVAAGLASSCAAGAAVLMQLNVVSITDETVRACSEVVGCDMERASARLKAIEAAVRSQLSP
jgi:formiminotetrahydrofolate cyclodeaminase